MFTFNWFLLKRSNDLYGNIPLYLLCYPVGGVMEIHLRPSPTEEHNSPVWLGLVGSSDTLHAAGYTSSRSRASREWRPFGT